MQRGTALLPQAPSDTACAGLVPPGEGEDIVLDYATTGLTLRRHPLAVLRPHLVHHVTAAQLPHLTSGRQVRATGIVTCRQRPGTASGVVFVTLEDETGNINVVVWSHLVEKQRRELVTATLLTVHGRLEKSGDVIHLIAERLVDRSALLGRLSIPARDFH